MFIQLLNNIKVTLPRSRVLGATLAKHDVYSHTRCEHSS